jgi:hypothetical protein
MLKRSTRHHGKQNCSDGAARQDHEATRSESDSRQPRDNGGDTHVATACGHAEGSAAGVVALDQFDFAPAGGW